MNLALEWKPKRKPSENHYLPVLENRLINFKKGEVMATTKQSKKSESKSTIGAIFDKAKEVIGDILAGAGTGAVVGAADAAVKSAGGETASDKAKGNGGVANGGARGKPSNGAPSAKKTASRPVAKAKSTSKPPASKSSPRKSTKVSAAK
jgi:hypothetical protein